MSLSHQDILRFSRQLIVKGWGRKSQELLMAAPVYVSVDLPLARRYLLAAGAPVVDLQTQARFAAAILTETDCLPHESQSSYTLICGKDGNVRLSGSSEVYSALPSRLTQTAEHSDTGLAPAQLLCVLLVMKHIAAVSIVKV